MLCLKTGHLSERVFSAMDQVVQSSKDTAEPRIASRENPEHYLAS